MSFSSIHQASQRARRAIVGACALRVPQFARLLPRPVPLSVLRYEPPGEPARKRLLILLPGIGDTAASYDRQGFVAAAQRGEHVTDVWAVDAHVGYYASRTILTRVHEDLIEPARERGYRSITLAGISLGGFGALLYASQYPGALERVIAIAPFLGRPGVVREIGITGLPAWTSPAIAAHDYERRLWAWLQGYALPDVSSTLPALFLGYGDRDCFAPAHRLLSAVLPHQRVFVTAGGHTWSTWRQLWTDLSTRSDRA
jgi:pimeloyl-ACP methyl ester carboxylesterase